MTTKKHQKRKKENKIVEVKVLIKKKIKKQNISRKNLTQYCKFRRTARKINIRKREEKNQGEKKRTRNIKRYSSKFLGNE